MMWLWLIISQWNQNPRSIRRAFTLYCSKLWITKNREGGLKFIHTLHDNIAIVKAVRCSGLLGDLKPELKAPTVTSNWPYRFCDTCHIGNKLCSEDGDWSSTAPCWWHHQDVMQKIRSRESPESVKTPTFSFLLQSVQQGLFYETKAR